MTMACIDFSPCLYLRMRLGDLECTGIRFGAMGKALLVGRKKKSKFRAQRGSFAKCRGRRGRRGEEGGRGRGRNDRLRHRCPPIPCKTSMKILLLVMGDRSVPLVGRGAEWNFFGTSKLPSWKPGRPQLWRHAYFSLMAGHETWAPRPFSSGAVRPDLARVHLLVTAHHKNEAYMHVLLPPENFEKLLSGHDGASLEVGLKSWCVVTCKLE